jgi:RNA polymerase sigma-70 factor (ECF subfamily)
MDSAPGSRTSETLLGRLRQVPTDQEAWAVFVERYVPRIHDWCRHWGEQYADAEEVTQTVLMKLARALRHFAYDPGRSFRGWLKTVTRHAWSDFVARRQRDVQSSGDSQLQTVEAREDLVQRLNVEFDQELLEEATARVRLRVEPQTWEAYRLTEVEGLSGAQAADRLGIKVAALYKATNRVLHMLQEEVRRLEGTNADERP